MSVFLLMSLYLASYNVAGTAAVPCVGVLIALVHGLGNGRQFRWWMQLRACSLKLVGMASMQRHDKNTYTGTLAKSAGGLMQEGDVIVEFYSSSSIVPSWRGTFDQCMSAITDKYNSTNDTCSWLLYSWKYSLSKTFIKPSYPCITEIIIGINFRPCSKKT